MRNFSDTRHFGAACTGLATLATSYVADANGWHLIILPLLLILVYYLIFRAGDIERPRWGAGPLGRTEIWLM